MLNAVIRRRDYLMDEIREPGKVVSLVGTLDLGRGDEPRFTGAAIIFIVFVLTALVAILFNLK